MSWQVYLLVCKICCTNISYSKSNDNATDSSIDDNEPLDLSSKNPLQLYLSYKQVEPLDLSTKKSDLLLKCRNERLIDTLSINSGSSEESNDSVYSINSPNANIQLNISSPKNVHPIHKYATNPNSIDVSSKSNNIMNLAQQKESAIDLPNNDTVPKNVTPENSTLGETAEKNCHADINLQPTSDDLARKEHHDNKIVSHQDNDKIRMQNNTNLVKNKEAYEASKRMPINNNYHSITLSAEEPVNKKINSASKPSTITTIELSSDDKEQAVCNKRPKIKQCFVSLTQLADGLDTINNPWYEKLMNKKRRNYLSTEAANKRQKTQNSCEPLNSLHTNEPINDKAVELNNKDQEQGCSYKKQQQPQPGHSFLESPAEQRHDKNDLCINTNYPTYNQGNRPGKTTLTERTEDPLDYFDAVVDLLKNLFYYRMCISNFFFYNFDRLITFYLKKEREGLFFKRFLELSIEFAKQNEQKIVIERDFPREYMQKYEKLMSGENTGIAWMKGIEKTKAYIIIRDYNFKYILNMNAQIKESHFNKLYDQMKCIRFYVPIARYYNMFYDFFKSLYKIKLIIDQHLDTSLQNHLIEINAFGVRDCTCSNEIKQNFVFHWAFCWMNYFSTNFVFPKLSSCSKELLWSMIDDYPREFFVQFIVLVHTIINYKNEKIQQKDLSGEFLVAFKAAISKRLYNIDILNPDGMIYYTLRNLFKQIENYHSLDVLGSRLLFPNKTIQTAEENTETMNKLIPASQDLVRTIFKFTVEAYEQVKKAKITA